MPEQMPEGDTSVLDDEDFMAGMKDVLGMEGDDVEKLISRMDIESLTALTDAISSTDKDAAEAIIGSFDTDEDVNPLFRSGDHESEEKESPKKLKRATKDHQFSYGDAVYVMRRDEKGKKKFIGATVDKPLGPHDTIGIKIDGKPKMTNYNRIYVEEGVLVGIPNLQRIQQLAGMQPSGLSVSSNEPPNTPADNGVQVTEVPGSGFDSAAQQINGALDTLEQALPNVRLADLKAIKQRILNIQSCINEGVTGREKKI